MALAVREPALAAAARLDWLRERLRQAGRVRVAESAAELGVSEMTVRRDLDALEELGWARRVRGGALGVGPAPMADRQRRHGRAKGVIAAKLARLVPATGAIALDASSTVLRLAALLPPARDLSVVTNSLATFEALAGRPGVVPVLTGGEPEPRTGSLVGPLATQAARRVATSRLFMSAAAVDPTLGPSEASLAEAEVKLALAEVAAGVVLAADSGKLGSRAVAPSLPWDRIELLVTELDPTHERLQPYRELVELA